MDIFNFASNCSYTAVFYNAWHSGAGNLRDLLRPLLSLEANVTDEFLEAQLNNRTFVKMLLHDAGSECQDSICSSLNFPGNADIARIGVNATRAL